MLEATLSAQRSGIALDLGDEIDPLEDEVLRLALGLPPS
jgi:hypothetical protein